MKPWSRRVLSLVLAICLCLTMLPGMMIQADAASNSEIRSKIISILYNGAGGRLSCDFDGYVSTSGRHEGIDFCASGGKGTSIVPKGCILESVPLTESCHAPQSEI